MSTIRVDKRSCISSGLGPVGAASRIELAPKALAQGGQGAIYEARSLDGKPTSDVLVKVFSQNIPPNLQAMLSEVGQSPRLVELRAINALRALPWFCFEGQLNGARVSGTAAWRAPGLTYSDLREKLGLQQYLQIPLPERLELSRQMAEGMAELYRMTMIHADLNGPNLMVDLESTALAIIDFDGGALARQGHKPAVAGKLEPGWLAPEIWDALGKPGPEVAPVSAGSDRWAVAAGVHFLLFGVSQFFFLASGPDIDRYLRKCQWPDLGAVPEVAFRNQPVHALYQREYAKMTTLQPLFRAAFQNGYKTPSARPSASEWRTALKSELRRLKPSGRLSKPQKISPQNSKTPRPSLRPPANMANSGRRFAGRLLKTALVATFAILFLVFLFGREPIFLGSGSTSEYVGSESMGRSPDELVTEDSGRSVQQGDELVSPPGPRGENSDLLDEALAISQTDF